MQAAWKSLAYVATVLALGLALPFGFEAKGGSKPSYAYFIDTGPGPDNVDISQTPSAQLSYDQWLGFRVDVRRFITIVGVEGWMSIVPGGQGSGRIALYKDSGGIPGARLFAGTFNGAVTDPTGSYGDADWIGALNLNWKLKPGIYWVTFESDGSGGTSGWLTAGFLLPSSSPVPVEAYRPCCTGAAWVTAPLGLGVRVTERTK